MPQGLIRHYVEAKGYGFIAPDAGGSDLLVNIKAFPLGIIPHAGMRVSYDTAINLRTGRAEAVGIRVL
jgi:cold shock protein